MEPRKDDELLETLSALRPEPRPEFTDELDARAAAGFPRRSRLRALAPTAALDRLRAMKPRQVLLPAGGLALTAVLIATVVVSQNDGSDGDIQLGLQAPEERLSTPGNESAGRASDTERHPPEEAEESNTGAQYEAEVPQAATEATSKSESSAAGSGVPASAPAGGVVNARKRAIERSTAIVLGTEPEEVGRASSEVFEVVHANRGIVLNSRTRDGAAGRAEATFELMIPSGKVGDAMAGFSRIGEVRSRQEATTDITAPTVSTAERLQDSQARIDSLLAQLAAAETEGERETVEAELRGERRRAAALRAQLQNLDRRASLSQVSLRIVGGEGSAPDEGGAWGVGDALDSAGRILAVGAGVALLGLAVVAPLALLALLAWLARRIYLRRARQSALG
jgi:hypothetical protein